MRYKGVMLGILRYLQQMWETWGVESPDCPSIREANKGLEPTGSGEVRQVARYFLGSHGALKGQLGKLGLSASRLVAFISGWEWEVAVWGMMDYPGVFLGWWKAGVPQRTELCDVCRHRPHENLPWAWVSDCFLSFASQFLTWHLLKWVISLSVIILITTGFSVHRFAPRTSTVNCNSYQ